MKSKILIIGACGQIGSELTLKLRRLCGLFDISYILLIRVFSKLLMRKTTQALKCVLKSIRLIPFI